MRRARVVVGCAAALVVLGVWWVRCSGTSSGPEPPPVRGEAAPAARSGRAEEPEGVIDLRFGAPAAVAGVVKDGRGRPVAGAQVCASALSERLTRAETRQPRCATSERDGHYRLDGLFGVRHELVAGAPGFVPTLYARGEGASRREWVDLRPAMEMLGADIVLEDGGVEIFGVVKDLSGGPIEGARVQGYRSLPVLSGPEGEFSLWVRRATVGLTAEAEGYASGRDTGAAPGHRFALFLTPEAVIVGKVVRADDGAPVAGIAVAFGSRTFTTAPQTRTDADGAFRLERLSPGAYKPYAESDELYGLADEQVPLGLGETSAPIEIRVHPAFMVEGRVVIAGGASCERGAVALKDAAAGRSARGQVEQDGVVRLRGLLAGEYAVDVSCEGYVPEDRYEKVKITGRGVAGVEWRVSRGQAIRGQVVDAQGQPTALVDVYANQRPDPGQARAGRTTSSQGRTDASGRFELAGLLAGTYELTLSPWHPQRSTPAKPTEVTLPKGQDVEGVRIELPATGEIHGTVRDAKGRPVRGAQVVLVGGTSRHAAMVSDEGAFRVEHVAAGEYRALAEKGWEPLRAPGTGDDDVQGERLEVRAGAVTTVNLVVADATGTITGVVRDEHGAPVADAFVEATRESDSATASAGKAAREGRWNYFWRTPNLTDADGRFSLSELAEGRHTLRAHRRGGGEAIAEHVAIGGEVSLTIEAAGRMAGTVTTRGGGAPEEFSVVVVDEASGFSRRDQFYRTGGAWSFPDLPAGTFKVRVGAGGGNAEAEVTLAAGQELSGVRIELTPRVTVRGTVTDLEGTPVPGLRVFVRGGAGGSIAPDDRSNVTDASGRFEYPNAPSGPVQVHVMPQSRGDAEFARVSVPAVLSGDAATVELPPIRVARQRLGDGEGAGDLGYKTREREPGADPLQWRWVVAHVRPDGPAAAAGLQVGDEIVRVEGQDVVDANKHLYLPLTRVAPGATVTLGLARGVSVQLTAGAPP